MQFPSRKVSSADCQLNWEALLKLLPQSGDLKMGAYATPDDGWLLCDGSSYDPQKYPDLYSKIGTTYGGTSSAPLLPDFRGRVPAGSGTGDASGATPHTLGSKVGKQTHSLTKAELATHTHDKGTLNITTGGSHAHTTSTNLPAQAWYEGGAARGGNTGTLQAGFATLSVTVNANTHTHPSSEFAGATGDGSADTLAGTAHENRTPSSVVNFFIKT